MMGEQDLLDRNSEVGGRDSIKRIREDEYDREGEVEERMKKVLEEDDKDTFIKLLNELPCEPDAVDPLYSYLYEADAVECYAALVDGLITLDENARILNISSYAGQLGSTPLHVAASNVSPNIISFILDRSPEDANVRMDHLENPLPLHAALRCIRGGSWWRDCQSVIKLLAVLCSIYKGSYMDSVRLLARHTRDIDQEMLNFMKLGKDVELCALMLAGYNPSTAAVQEWEQEGKRKKGMVQLLEVFEKIGDKLVAYAMIKRENLTTDKAMTELATLFEDAAIPVTSKDLSIYHMKFNDGTETQDKSGRHIFKTWSVPCELQMDFSSLLSGGESPLSRAFSRSYHSSSMAKAKTIYFTKMKTPLVPRINPWWKCVVAARRGIRYL